MQREAKSKGREEGERKEPAMHKHKRPVCLRRTKRSDGREAGAVTQWVKMSIVTSAPHISSAWFKFQLPFPLQIPAHRHLSDGSSAGVLDSELIPGPVLDDTIIGE